MQKSGGVSAYLVAFILGGVHVPAVFAQSDPGYQIGDRVEADGTSLPEGPYKRWTKATVVGVVGNGYVVLLDGPLPRHVNIVGYSPQASRRIAGHVVPPPGCRVEGQSSAAMESVAQCWDRAAAPQGTQAAQGGVQTRLEKRAAQVATPNGANVGVAAPVGTILPGVTTCPQSNPGRGKNALEQQFREATVRRESRPAAPGMDGEVTTVIESFTVAPPRRWQIEDAYGTADRSKPIYPTQTQFIQCTEYRTAIELARRTENQDCFWDLAGHYSCSTTAGLGGPGHYERHEKH